MAMPINYNELLNPEVQYKAFSGTNIHAVIGNRRLATLQALTCSITREVAALYGFGDANPKAFVKGKRGIAGTMVFTQFDRHALLGDVFREAYNRRLDSPLFGDRSSPFQTRALTPETAGRGANLLAGNQVSSRNFGTLSARIDASTQLFDGGVAEDIRQQLYRIGDLVGRQRLVYVDQLPLFDVTVVMLNESGDAAFWTINGIQLVNEGMGYTLDDLTSDAVFTYVARAVTPLTAIASPNTLVENRSFA